MELNILARKAWHPRQRAIVVLAGWLLVLVYLGPTGWQEAMRVSTKSSSLTLATLRSGPLPYIVMGLLYCAKLTNDRSRAQRERAWELGYQAEDQVLVV